ncbi:hypothetical protein FB446DRAFT_298494 [Lentinula raphanica]|uniref:DUF6593 domain-containing protein n=1 Tax=Lentinula raphanica TaxID=153919 RepID=A0AA38PE25_9AGAR|nr:hypothetical protein C8R42DRAFT_653144 [Lentinula raphanica]KAJ3776425.1 hypothetical protein FB446DRAFT_298494 [Lentinula raphanica]KAJ3840846.1 hypothetical protein F5878DRAFT_46211 [Lentinula raphanica]
MVFTPDATLIIRSKEYGDGSEYDIGSTSSMIPDHYVKRIWRKPGLLAGTNGTRTVQFINKSPDSNDRSTAYSAAETKDVLIFRVGGYSSGDEFAKVQWVPGNGKPTDRSIVTLGNKTGMLKDILKKSNALSTSRVFTGPDGVEYKWKVIWVGNDPAFPEATFRTLYARHSKHPIATTARLTSRDGLPQDEAYPIYIAEQGLNIQHYIVATLAILETFSPSSS